MSLEKKLQGKFENFVNATDKKAKKENSKDRKTHEADILLIPEYDCSR